MSLKPKNQAQIQAMREGGRILGEILSTLASELKPGMSTMDLEQRAEALFKEYNVAPGFKGYNGYPCILCTSVNNEVVHGIPNEIPLNEGDILSIDCGVLYKGLNTDSAIAVVVGGTTHPSVQKFVDTCIEALWAGIEEVKPGNTVGDIGYAIERVIKRGGYNVIPELTGHGIGEKLHEAPYIYNYGRPGKGMKLEAGMTIAIEPIMSMGNPAIETLDDNWTIVTQDGSLSIQHEHTVLVTEDGVEVLTLRKAERDLI